MAPAQIWEELKRRKVIRLGLLYLVVAWVVIQAADIIFPALNIPDWAVSLVVVLVILGFPVAVVLSWMFDVTPAGVRRAGRSPRRDPVRSKADGAAANGERSIAVLPFVNMSDDRENEYFSDGMTEEILNALAKVRDLRVASRTSSFAFKGKEADVRDIAEQLSVETVLEGSVRKAGERIRITAQLIDAGNGYHLWSHTYDRELADVFEIQDQIARAIVDALKVQLGADQEAHLVERETGDMEAYNFYLKGRYFYNRDHEEDLRRSLDMYREALKRDPRFARAEAGMADTWMHLADDWVAPDEAYPEAKAAARRALELDDSIAEAHTALGNVLGWFDWAFDEAELALRRAVAANPRYADGHWGLATILPCTGRLSEAVDAIQTAVKLDPVSTTFSFYLARFLMFKGDLDEAKEEAERTMALDPGSFRPLLVLGQVHLLAGRPDEALETFRRAREVSAAPSVDTFTARAMAAVDDPDGARALLAGLEAGDDYVRSEFVATAWAALGELDRAFEALEQAYVDRSGGLIYLHVDPAFEPLRNDARFRSLVERIGLRVRARAQGA